MKLQDIKNALYLLLKGWFPVKTDNGWRWQATYMRGKDQKVFQYITYNALQHQRRQDLKRKREKQAAKLFKSNNNPKRK